MAPGIGTQQRQHHWSRASCHGNAERWILEVFLEGEMVGVIGGGDGGQRDGLILTDVPSPVAIPGGIDAESH